MSTQHRTAHTARLGLAALLSLGTLALAPAPLAQADPPGNNGTVKIAPLGEIDSIPNNTPHVGCSFEVEWYGFDEGTDIESTVTFEEQAPTTGVGMTWTGTSPVEVGGDPATGAGTDTGFDGREVYTLAFTGAPHPQQGYHVKLTIHTPGSIGNDTKYKVFWVEGCAPVTPPTTPPPTTPPTTTPPTTTPTTTTPPTTTAPTNAPNTPHTPNTPEVLPGEEQAPEVLGEQAFGNNNEVQTQQQLPTAVNAGLPGRANESPAGISLTQSLLGLLLVLLGAVTARLGWIRARG